MSAAPERIIIDVITPFLAAFMPGHSSQNETGNLKNHIIIFVITITFRGSLFPPRRPPQTVNYRLPFRPIRWSLHRNPIEPSTIQ